MRPSNFPGVKDPRKQSRMGQLADREVELTQGSDWSRNRIINARQLADAIERTKAEAARRNAPDLKESPSYLSRAADSIFQRVLDNFTPSDPNKLPQGQRSVMDVEVEDTRPRGTRLAEWTRSPEAVGDVVGLIADPLNALFGGTALKAAKLASQKAAKAVPYAATAAGAAYASDAEASPLHKMLQMVYRGRAGDAGSTTFASPQRKVAEYYAAKRAAQTGNQPHVDSLMVDPFAGRKYGHSIPMDSFNRDVVTTQARELGPEDVVGTYAKGGLARIAARMGKDAAPARKGVADVIKNKGGNWLTGSVEDALGRLKRREAANSVEALREELVGVRSGTDTERRILAEIEHAQRAPAINSFIDKQLVNYIKKEMATPEDPIRALAEKGVLHFDTGAGWVPEASETLGAAAAKGAPARIMGRTPMARDWESLSDSAVIPYNKSDFKTLGPELEWMKASRDPNPLVHAFENEDTLGFDHLIDELSNAINPESGLPRNLQLDPASLPRVSVPQAVERVAEINKWRAAQKAEADMLRANNAATFLHKEYPDKGFKWVELRNPENVEGLTASSDIREFKDASGKIIRPLEDALKYEGDTMGHCVGGYCDDVASGRSKIYSLRDAKGQPHVTIETATPQYMPRHDDIIAELERRGIRDGGNVQWDLAYDEVLKDLQQNRPPVIKQIKGKQNRAPNEEYLPFVQDFVKSGQWSDVGDLQNAGLVKFGKSDMRQAIEQFLPNEGPYYTQAEMDAAEAAYKAQLPKYAHGGSVKSNLSVQDLRGIIQQIRQEHINA